MFKRFKRYVNNLSYKQTERLILGICLAVALLMLLFPIFNWDIISNKDFFDTFFVIFLTGFLIPVAVGCILYFALNAEAKKLDEESTAEKKELENIFTNSNSTAKLIVSESTENFPRDIVLFYLEQKGAQFWIEVENSEESDKINAKIYITDKDNPGEKIVYPDTITNPLYVKSHFEIEN